MGDFSKECPLFRKLSDVCEGRIVISRLQGEASPPITRSRVAGTVLWQEEQHLVSGEQVRHKAVYALLETMQIGYVGITL